MTDRVRGARRAPAGSRSSCSCAGPDRRLTRPSTQRRRRLRLEIQSQPRVRSSPTFVPIGEKESASRNASPGPRWASTGAGRSCVPLGAGRRHVGGARVSRWRKLERHDVSLHVQATVLSLALSLWFSPSLSDSLSLSLSLPLSLPPSLRPSVPPSLRPSFRPSVRTSVRPSVRPSFLSLLSPGQSPVTCSTPRPGCRAVPGSLSRKSRLHATAAARMGMYDIHCLTRTWLPHRPACCFRLPGPPQSGGIAARDAES